MRTLPDFAVVDRSLPEGLHPYAALLPHVLQSPALRRITPSAEAARTLVAGARVAVQAGRGYAYVDVNVPCIVLSEWYYRGGSGLDLYLDLLHELTHLRQLSEGADLWDERFAYVDRPTEIEGYAVAVEEGRRLGMTPVMVQRHLSNPWMTAEDVVRLVAHIDRLLAGGAALSGG
ncbi:MAG: hypothetical protein HY904_17905 [Deltaproteobacteria bacterium]|nr:hypothetical protein [Deltaproteobacteria bacterium]